MKIERKEIVHLANLANLNISEQDIADIHRKLSDIVSYIDTLKELETSTGTEISNFDSTPERLDEVQPSLPPEVALAEAPAKIGTAFRVPRIIDVQG